MIRCFCRYEVLTLFAPVLLINYCDLSGRNLGVFAPAAAPFPCLIISSEATASPPFYEVDAVPKTSANAEVDLSIDLGSLDASEEILLLL